MLDADGLMGVTGSEWCVYHVNTEVLSFCNHNHGTWKWKGRRTLMSKFRRITRSTHHSKVFRSKERAGC